MRGPIGSGAVKLVQEGRVTGYGLGYEENGASRQEWLLYDDYVGYPEGPSEGAPELGWIQARWVAQETPFTHARWIDSLRRGHNAHSGDHPFGQGLQHPGHDHIRLCGVLNEISAEGDYNPPAGLETLADYRRDDFFNCQPNPFIIFGVRGFDSAGWPLTSYSGYLWAAPLDGYRGLYEAWALDPTVAPPARATGFQLEVMRQQVPKVDGLAFLNQMSTYFNWPRFEISLEKTDLPE